MTGIAIFVNLMASVLAFSLRKDMLNPLFLFSVIWNATLILLFVSSASFYPINIATEFVFVVGTLGFMFGYILVELQALRPASTISHPHVASAGIKRGYLWAILAVLCIGWFEYYRQMSELTSGSGLFFTFQEARHALVEASFTGEKLIGPIANFEVIAIYFSLLCVIERKNGKYGDPLVYCSLLLAAIYVVLGGAKGGLVTLTLVCFFIYSFDKPWKVIARRGTFAFIAVLAFFCLGLIVVNFTYNEFSGTGEMVAMLFTSVRNYWVGGLVAFDQVVTGPEQFEHFQSVTRFFMETANSLGGSFHVPSVHAGYVPISDSEDTNVFTIYYSYFLDGGIPAVFLLSCLYSYCLSLMYLRAKAGDKRFLLLYALLLAGVVFSIVSERFFLGLNGTIKAVAFWWGCYYFLAERKRALTPLQAGTA
jgi:oligosaccharide repeat unit polymerase